MSQTAAFIARLMDERLFGPGQRTLLRALAGRGLDENTPGFDLFTRLWWPLRQKNQAAPRREVGWLVAKLYAACSIPHVRPEGGKGPPLAQVLGGFEPREPQLKARFRRGLDALLCTPLSGLEPHLRWALLTVAGAVKHDHAKGLDWVQLLDDLSVWDRGDEDRRKRDVRDIWAEEYLNAVTNPKGASHAD